MSCSYLHRHLRNTKILRARTVKEYSPKVILVKCGERQLSTSAHSRHNVVTSANDESLRERFEAISEARMMRVSSFVIKRIFRRKRRRCAEIWKPRNVLWKFIFCDVTPNVARFHRAFETTTTTSDSSSVRRKGVMVSVLETKELRWIRLMYEEGQGGMLRPSEWWIEQRKIADENGRENEKTTFLMHASNETCG